MQHVLCGTVLGGGAHKSCVPVCRNDGDHFLGRRGAGEDATHGADTVPGRRPPHSRYTPTLRANTTIHEAAGVARCGGEGNPASSADGVLPDLSAASVEAAPLAAWQPLT